MMKLRFESKETGKESGYAVVNTSTNEVMISAPTIVDLYLIFQSGINYALADTDENIIQETTKARRHF